MKVKYLGTAAAEGIPGLFCNCKVCQNALRVRGKEIKTRSQSLIDDFLLIDFPVDTYMHILYGGLDLRKIRHCIVTHAHSDHFYANDFWCRLKGIANDIQEEPFHVYLTSAAYKKADDVLGEAIHGQRLEFHEIRAFDPFTVDEYRIIPLRADHDPKADPVIYIIEKGEKSILYANDTGIFPDCTWDYLKDYGRKFDLVSMDCTAMLLKGWHGSHMSLDVNAKLYERLCEMGLCDEHTTAIVNHFSHNGLATHEELTVAARAHGFTATYDGFEVEV